MKVTNPSTNAYAITSITVLAPTNFAFAGSATCGPVGSGLATVGVVSTTAIQCTDGATAGLPPGFSATLTLGTLAWTGTAPVATLPPNQGTFTTLVVDSSGAASYAGGSFTEWDIATTTIAIALSPSVTQFTAGGSALTVTATLSSGQSGVPIVWSFSNAAYPTSGYTASLSPTSGVTTSSGTSTTFTPSNWHADATAVVATIGTSATTASTASVQTIAGAPTKVSFYFTVSSVIYSSDYLTAHTTVSTTIYAETGSEVSLSLSDAYANPVAFSVAITNITLSGVGGQFLSGANLYGTISCGSVVAGNSHFACPTSGNSIALPFAGPINYVQSSIYGAVGEIAGTIFKGATQYTGTSGNIITGTLGTLAQTKPTSATNVAAGSSVLVQEQLSVVQTGVPISLNLCTSPCATSTSYNAKFSNGLSAITLTANSTGGVESLVAVNTTSGSIAYFNATAAAPTTILTTATIASAVSGAVTTIPGAISTLVVNIAASNTPPSVGPNIKSIVNGSTAYVDVAYADAYNNLVTAAPGNQIQIGLAASAGALSATNVYISAGQLSTNSSSFGAILWTLPSTVGTTATITASANVNGKAVQGTSSVLTVSAYPSLNVTSPAVVSGVLYSSTAFVTFTGIANATAGSASTTIASIGYKVGTGGWQSVSTASLHNLVWTVPLVLALGLNTVTFNVTDSAALTTVSPAWSVLVDTSAPTFGTIKLASATSSTAQVNVTSAEGDLNATSVTATANGTAIAASQISVSGTNNPGSSVTYLVSISNLAQGTWSLTVSAKTLAGLSASASGTVTVTVVPPPPGQTFVFPSAPVQVTGPTGPAVNATIKNNGTSSYTAYVYVVVHNSAGTTVYIGIANFGSIAAGGSATLPIPVVLPKGTYSATVQAYTSAGITVSGPQTVAITV